MFSAWKIGADGSDAAADASAYALMAESMTASEQMFFLGSPLAHVVQYEDELRADRLRRVANLRQARRLIADIAASED